MRRLLCLFLAVGFSACGDAQGCGGESDYAYPRFDLDAIQTRRAVRVRLTESGMAAVADGVPDLITGSCAAGAAGACQPDPNPAYPDRVRFYVPSSATSADSYLAIDMDSMAGNVHIGLIAETGDSGQLEVIIGCDAPFVSQCNDAATYGDQYISGSVDMVVYPNTYAACFVQEDAPPGFIIRSMRMWIRPRIELGADLKPYLILDREDVTVRDMDVEFNILVGPAVSDPECNQSVPILGDVCSFECGLINWGEAFAEFLFETDFIDEVLAKSLADLVLSQFAAQALEAEGALDLGAQLPVGNPRANPTGFLFSATVAQPNGDPPVFSPWVTSGSTDNLGWNFDFDLGFAADPGPCVPPPAPVSWVSPPMPAVDSQVQAVDPDTGLVVSEDIDLAVLLGDIVFKRATYELFESGGLCMNIGAGAVGQGSPLVPTVGMVSLLAPGLPDLAPAAAPVNFVLSPRLRPHIEFGSGIVDDTQTDSHFQLTWPELWIDLYPLVDDAFVRALTFTVDLKVFASFYATPEGNLEVMLDDLYLYNVAEVYNEMTAPFDTEGLETLLGLLLPMILTGEPIEVPLSGVDVGIPFGVRVRAIEQLGSNGNYLGAFLRFCNGAAMADPSNALCYVPDPGPGKSAGGADLAAGWVSGPGEDDERSTVRVTAASDLASGDELELAYRVDGGPWFGFRAPGADGLFALRHPRFAVEGEHRLEVVGRHRWRTHLWTAPFELTVTSARRERRATLPLEPVIAASEPEAIEVRAPTVPDTSHGCHASGGATTLGSLLALTLMGLRRRRR